MAGPLDTSKFFICTATESQARASIVLPHGPSEDARTVLGPPPVPISSARADAPGRERGYFPSVEVEWVVHVDARGKALRRDDILATFSFEWLAANGSPAVHGYSPEIDRWTYVNAAGVPETYSRLALAWEYVPFRPEVTFDAETAEGWLEATREAAGRLDRDANVRADVAPEDAEERAEALAELKEEIEDAGDPIVRLVAETRFDGRELWDALTSLGLVWGDGDLFHWRNENPELGDDAYFSVETSTEPGYFLPEHAANGHLAVEDLVFSFSVARTAAPLAVADAMLRAAEYVRDRLGGELVGPDDEDLAAEDVRALVADVEARLRRAGFVPGTDAALRLF